MSRTFAASDWVAAQAAWSEAELGTEWAELRRRAALRGLIYPPNGSRWDSWDDDSPSQVAIVIRAIRETPDLVLSCVDRSTSWGEAIGLLIEARDRWQRDQKRRVAADELHWAATKARDRAQAAAVMSRIDAAMASTSAPATAQEGAVR
jgi:hypothetical protein